MVVVAPRGEREVNKNGRLGGKNRGGMKPVYKIAHRYGA